MIFHIYFISILTLQKLQVKMPDTHKTKCPFLVLGGETFLLEYISVFSPPASHRDITIPPKYFLN